MADNTTLPGTGDVIATDDISGVKHQLVKIEWGPADTANQTDVASGKALPVQFRSATGLIPIGEPTDAAATATDTTSVSGISIWKQISKSVQLSGTAANQTLQVAQETAINTVLGTTTGAAVVTDVAGTVQQYMRGLVKLIAAGINVVITNANANGQTTASASAPVVIASDQPPVSTQLAPAANLVSGAITTAMTGTTTTSLVAAPGSGLRNYITTIVVSNSHATVGTDVVIQDGSGGTTLMTIPAAALYGGGVIALPAPLRQPTANTALFCANVTTGASTKVSAVGFKAA